MDRLLIECGREVDKGRWEGVFAQMGRMFLGVWRGKAAPRGGVLGGELYPDRWFWRRGGSVRHGLGGEL